MALLAPFRDQIPERIFTEPFALPVSTGNGLNRAVLDRARQLLADAGWVIVDGRLKNERGQPFTLEIATQHVTLFMSVGANSLRRSSMASA